MFEKMLIWLLSLNIVLFCWCCFKINETYLYSVFHNFYNLHNCAKVTVMCCFWFNNWVLLCESTTDMFLTSRYVFLLPLSPWRCSTTRLRSALKAPSLCTRRWATSVCRCSNLWKLVSCPVLIQRHRRCPHGPSAWDRGRPPPWIAWLGPTQCTLFHPLVNL